MQKELGEHWSSRRERLWQVSGTSCTQKLFSDLVSLMLSHQPGFSSYGPSKICVFRNVGLGQPFHLSLKPSSLLQILRKHEALAKWRPSFYRHLAFLLHLQQRLRIEPFKLSFITSFHCIWIKIDISNTVKWSMASDSTSFWDPVYVKVALHTLANLCHWHQLRTLYFIT